MRLLIISGHGNALQSATALATGAYAARKGVRVLVASAGPTHRLGSLLGRELGPRPLELEPNFAVVELSARDEIGQRWDAQRAGFRTGLTARLREVGGDELASFPGMDLVGMLMVADRAAQSGRFDLMVCDGPDNDSLLRSLALPDTLRWFVRLIFGLTKGPGRSRSSQELALLPVALLPMETTGPLQDLRLSLEQQRARLAPEAGTRVRLALPVEELSLPPLRTALGGFGLFGLEVDAVLARGASEELDEQTKELFTPGASRVRPRLQCAPLPVAPTDLAGWAERGTVLYAANGGELALPDPGTIKPPALPSDNMSEVRLRIPFLEARGIDITVASEEVVLRLGPFRRHVLLPGMINSGGKLRARVENETLRLWVE